jgi:hypothetical protein
MATHPNLGHFSLRKDWYVDNDRKNNGLWRDCRPYLTTIREAGMGSAKALF